MESFLAMSKDKPYPQAVKLLENYAQEYEIAFITGRPERYRQETDKWLKINILIRTFKLIMRIKWKDFWYTNGFGEAQALCLLLMLCFSSMLQFVTSLSSVFNLLYQLVRQWFKGGTGTSLAVCVLSRFGDSITYLYSIAI